jgi:hypothetical protein
MKKTIAIYQIIGGLLGVTLIVLALDMSYTNNVELILVTILPIIIVSLNIFAGGLLFQEKKIGFILTILNQLIQIVNFVYIGITYVYRSGIYLGIKIDNIDLHFDINLFDVQIVIGKYNSNPNMFGVNFIPIVIIILLVIYRKQTRSI